MVNMIYIFFEEAIKTINGSTNQSPKNAKLPLL
ncbi:hypothetical protein T190130A13A_110046 [Tenacibaculum sp. 190130A14a]|uniref:Uncharacterized protein n=1 Tax=Tenacibaculum polynesiense TaxID=3137857 RepID=A0ABM9P6V7_9FLAO